MGGPAPGITRPPVHRHQKALRWFSLLLVVGVLSAAFLLPLININRYHHAITETIARSLGHPVHLDSVKLQVFPRPGLAITGFAVEENPEFGAEPLLRSASVVVSVRLTSLGRGRLEVSRIDLDEASVNLVRNAAGQWNFGSLLEQAAAAPNAPTAQRHSGGSPRFPYIQFKSARINFKAGNEKKGFAFLNSDLSIWLDNPGQWRLRFEGQPVRTDLDIQLEESGLVRVEGSIDRAAALDQMPVKLHAEWNGVPLGQASRMIFADDKGWRGDLRAQTDIAGSLADLHLSTRLRVANAHREEFSPLSQLNIDAACRAEYRHAARALEDLTCLWPVGSGHLLLTGSLQSLPTLQTQLNLEINQTPAASALALLGLMRATVPSTWQAQGVISGSFAYASAPVPQWSGQATVRDLSLTFADGIAPFVIPALSFATPAVNPHAPPGYALGGYALGNHALAGHPLLSRKKAAVRSPAPAQAALVLDPAPLDMGAPGPFQVAGQFTAAGFSLHLTGQAGVDRLRDLNAAFASLRPAMGHLTPQGLADIDLTFAGPWLAESLIRTDGLPQASRTSVQGFMHLQNTRARLDWLPEPLQISSATADFGDGRVRWSNANLSVNGIVIHGSADAALQCEGPAPCPAHFNLDVPELDAATLQSAVLGAGRHGELLDKILAQIEVGQRTVVWPAVRGQASIGALSLGGLALRDVRLSIDVVDHKLDITSMDAAALGGSIHITGSVAATGSQPRYSLNTTLSGIEIAKAAALFKENWPASGLLDGGVNLSLQGYSTADLASSARGTFHWRWTGGSLTGSDSGAAAGGFDPSGFSQWNAAGAIADSVLTLNKAGLTNPVSGTIGFDRKLNLDWPLGREAAPMHIGGTLARPSIESVAPTATP